jgi:hypothetical protein
MAERDERDADRFFEDLAEATDVARRAPTRLKSRIYSALMLDAAASGPLRPLGACERAGHVLCVWEKLARVAAAGTLDEFNYCRVCHARVIGERVERAPLAWRGCPYADFQKG